MRFSAKNFDAFIFDWDGTLSTSSLIVYLSHFFKKRYYPQYIISHSKEFSRPTRLQMEEYEGEAKVADFIYGLYTSMFRPKLREGALQLLKELKSKGKKIALYSDGANRRVADELRDLGVERYFDVIVTAGAYKVYKPNPAGIGIAAKKLGVKKERCLYVGDMAIDVFTAKFAHVKVAAVGNGLDPKSRLIDAKPDYLFESTQALARSIAQHTTK